jgi:hypothetical protein
MMSNHELRGYLGLSIYEFERFLEVTHPDKVEAYRELALLSSNLEQLPTKYNRPPEPDEASDSHLDACSVAAFARLDAAEQANEASRQKRSEGTPRARQGRRSDCVSTGLELAAKVARLGK